MGSSYRLEIASSTTSTRSEVFLAVVIMLFSDVADGCGGVCNAPPPSNNVGGVFAEKASSEKLNSLLHPLLELLVFGGKDGNDNGVATTVTTGRHTWNVVP